ncbi:MAG: hypothetical protein QOH25_2960 [Acidobacteriota bacterium]|jgi:hypothetical protein|nr:hypothetical protein [Acidobacteriota bacterium]
MKNAGTALDDIKIHVKMKISALWVSVMLCYIYGDYFWLYAPGKLQGMLEGKMVPLGPTTQGVLLFTSVMMAIPSVMIFLSLTLKPNLNRWVNIILGVIYTVFVLITMPGAWVFYIFLGGVDVILTALIVWYAWNWPRQEAT